MSDAEAVMWTVEKDPALRSDFCNVTVVEGQIPHERMRDKIAHHYFRINLDVVWKTATDDLPALRP